MLNTYQSKLQIIKRDLSVEGRTVKLYEENMREHLPDLGCLKEDPEVPSDWEVFGRRLSKYVRQPQPAPHPWKMLTREVSVCTGVWNRFADPKMQKGPSAVLHAIIHFPPLAVSR